MSDVLEHTIGNLQFSWVKGSQTIEVYQLTEAGRPEKRIGLLATSRDDKPVPFEQGAFEEQCDWFLQQASTAEILVLDGRYDIQRISGGRLVQSLDGLDHTTAVGIVNIVWGEIPTTLEEGGDEDEKWKLHLGGEEWVIVRRVS